MNSSVSLLKLQLQNQLRVYGSIESEAPFQTLNQKLCFSNTPWVSPRHRKV